MEKKCAHQFSNGLLYIQAFCLRIERNRYDSLSMYIYLDNIWKAHNKARKLFSF